MEFSSSPVGGLLDLESPIHKQQHMNLLDGFDNDRQPVARMEEKSPTPYCTHFNKGKSVSPFDPSNNYNVSEDDEPAYYEDNNGENPSGLKNKKGSPWQRMKWTDEVVKLLITVVSHVGDDGLADGTEGTHKRKSGISQKKGKWKTISKIMIGKGCHVSPQQCEDKFNDLNKRYKRLNEILGKGISCRVVENPALMDSMPRLSAKAKDDVRKILSSKHLFYKEMCAYHTGQKPPDNIDLQGYSLPIEQCSRDNDNINNDNNNNNNGSDDEEGGAHEESDEDDESGDENGERRNGFKSFEVEMARVFEDSTVSLLEKKEWIKRQKLELLEVRVGIEAEAFELEKQRVKWLSYCDKKDMEFERLRLENERMRLENEQIILHMKKKKLEIGTSDN